MPAGRGLRAHGVKAFASVLGTDSDQALIGIPAFQAPVVNVAVPETAFFKWQESRGQADGLADAPPPATGHAKFDKFTVLVFFGFTVSDLGRHD